MTTPNPEQEQQVDEAWHLAYHHQIGEVEWKRAYHATLHQREREAVQRFAERVKGRISLSSTTTNERAQNLIDQELAALDQGER